MKQIAYIVLLAVALASCGTDSRHFKIDGRLLHLNQGEFYIYSLDGGMEGMDTIKVDAGRFTYEMPCTKPTTMMLIFPNFTEQPIFAQPGKSVDVEGDASHLKELTVKGTDDNELMNGFRKKIASASPPEAAKAAEEFVKANPQSAVGEYLVVKYFIQTPTPDLAKASALIAAMLKEQPKNGFLNRLQRQLSAIGASRKGASVPAFSAYDIDGRSVSDAFLSGAPAAVAFSFATWNFQSMAMLRQLNQLCRDQAGRLKVLAISVDANRKDVKNAIQHDDIAITIICDGDMVEGKAYKALGFGSIPDNILVRSGSIAGRSLTIDEIKNQLGAK